METKQWHVIRQSASYWDVGELQEGIVHPEQHHQEVAYSPVCRVRRHIAGKRHLAKVLAVPKLLEACKKTLTTLKEWNKLDGAWREVEEILTAAIAAAEGA